jgi:hypothetical protein
LMHLPKEGLCHPEQLDADLDEFHRARGMARSAPTFTWCKLRVHLRDWLASPLTPQVPQYTVSGQYRTDRSRWSWFRSNRSCGVSHGEHLDR